MKKTILSLILIVAAAFVVMAFTFPSGINSNPPQDKTAAMFPDDVQKIIESSCYDCHSGTSSNEKALEKLNFSHWGDLSKSKIVGKMNAIEKMLKEDEMPPVKYLNKNPGKALSKEQKGILYKWIDEESDKLMGK
jgi:hypothetical protein